MEYRDDRNLRWAIAQLEENLRDLEKINQDQAKRAKSGEDMAFESKNTREAIEFAKKNLEKAKRSNDSFTKLLQKYPDAVHNNQGECLRCRTKYKGDFETLETQSYDIFISDRLGLVVTHKPSISIYRCKKCRIVYYWTSAGEIGLY